jgi:hypothetical protein
MADMWNPIDALKQKYPNMGLSDAQILTKLQDPTKFRAAFPEYDGLSDGDIQTNMQKFAMTRPDLVAPPAPAGSGIRMDGTTGDSGPTNYQPVQAEQTPAGHQAAVNAREDALGTIGQVPIGVAKGVNETARGVGLEAGIKALAGDDTPNLDLSARNNLQGGGKVAESILEFVAGDEALKALPFAERLKTMGSVAQFLEDHSTVAKILNNAVVGAALRQGVVGAAQADAHGEDTGDALKTGGFTAAAGAAGEVAGKVLGVVGKEIQRTLAKTPLPGEADWTLYQIGHQIAEKADVPEFGPAAIESRRDWFRVLGDAVMQDSKDQFGAIDAATGNQLTPVQDRLRAVAMKLREAVGDDEVSGLLQQQAELEGKQEALFNKAAENGVTPADLQKARQTYKQASALYDVDRAVKASTKGVSPDVAFYDSPNTGNYTPEEIDPKQLFNRFQKLKDSGRLLDAFGGDFTHVKNIMQILDLSKQSAAFREGLQMLFGHSAPAMMPLRTLGGAYLGYKENGLKGAVEGAGAGLLGPMVVSYLLSKPLVLGALGKLVNLGASGARTLPGPLVSAERLQSERENQTP